MSMPFLFLIALCLHLALCLHFAAPAHAEKRTVGVDVPASAQEIAEALRNNGWISWLIHDRDDIDIVIGPGAEGDAVVRVRPLPIDDATASLLEGLPVRLGEDLLELDGTVYRKPQHTLGVRLPNADKPTWVVSGFRMDRVAELARQVLLKEAGVRMWGRPNEPFEYIVQGSRWLERSGNWHKAEHGLTVDPEERNDFPERDAYYAGMVTLPGRALELKAPPELAEMPEVRQLAQQLDAATQAMAQRVPVELEAPIRLVVERDHVAQGRHLGRIGEAVLADDGAVHIMYQEQDVDAFRHRIAEALIRRAGLDDDLRPWFREGAALWLSRGWYGRDFDEWLPIFATARLLPTFEQLNVAARQEDASAPLWVPPAAHLVASTAGETLLQKLANAPAAAKLKQRLTSLARLPKSAAPKRTQRDLPFLDGISFAMLNRLDGGYHAPSVNPRLAQLTDLGANAVSLMPFAYQPSATQPELRFADDRPTSETDIGVLYAARRAHAAGFEVLWKPHIWISSESWPGDIEMSDEASWSAWWDSYRRYIAHHAFLAEWAGCSLYSIGVELGRTVGREREWNELIASVRLLFSGAVTYSGNWHDDYELVPFWDQLDFVGVDAYFPLAESEKASPEAITRGARAVADRLRRDSERFGKPILLTEIGYAARTGAWVDPHQEGGTFSEAHQALAYRALFDALGRPDWLRGVFAWKVFTAERGRPDQPDFRFLGRQAEAAVRDYFTPPTPASGSRLTSQ